MKKFLVVMLAIAMIFTFASTALAADEQLKDFTDIADQTQAAKDAIMKLAVLGVLEGNEGIGGPYRPTENLTRAEFAKIVCYLTDNVKLANSLESVGSKFTDVTTGNWYTGWVNAAATSGYFIGDPGGTFRPNANITQNEVITVALRAMGYNDRVGSGSNNTIWPGNYVTKAVNIGILDDITLVGSSAATRAEAAIICAEVLLKNMVIHVSQELAFGIALAEGTADIDGFAEVYYMSNEGAGTQASSNPQKDARLAETILHKAFGCRQVSRATFALSDEYDEIGAWDYVDFKDGELEVYFDGNIPYGALEMATTYYINKGLKLPDLAGLEAKVVYHVDDREVKFVGVRGSAIYGKDVYVNSNNDRVTVDGVTYRVGSELTKDPHDDYPHVNHGSIGYGKPYDPTGCIYNTDSDNGIRAKVYLDKDGLVYAVKAYNGVITKKNTTVTPNVAAVYFNDYTDFPYGIFKEMDGQDAKYKNSPGKDLDIDTNKEYVLLKGSDLATVDALEENDVVYYLGKMGGGVKAFLAYKPLEGAMTKQNTNNGRITLDGYAYDTSEVSGIFQLSTNGGDTFKKCDPKVEYIDKSMFTDVHYMPGYDFGSVVYVASLDDSVKIIGVITGLKKSMLWSTDLATPGAAQKVTGITILTTENEEVTYMFEDDFSEAYNNDFSEPLGDGAFPSDDYDIYDCYDSDPDDRNITGAPEAWLVDNGLNKGDIVCLELNKNDEITLIDDFYFFDDGRAWDTGRSDLKPNGAKTNVTWDRTNKKYDVGKDAVVFNVVAKEVTSGANAGKIAYSSAEIWTVSELMADTTKAYDFCAFDTDNLGTEALVTYMITRGSSTKLGFVSDFWGSGSGRRIVLDGNEEARASQSPAQRRGLYLFNWDDGAVKLFGGDYVYDTAGPLKYTITAGTPLVWNDGTKTYNGYKFYDLTVLGNVAKSIYSSADAGAAAGLVADYGTNTIKVDGQSYRTGSAYIYSFEENDEITNLRDLMDKWVVIVYDGNDAQYIMAYEKAPGAGPVLPDATAPTAITVAGTALPGALTPAFSATSYNYTSETTNAADTETIIFSVTLAVGTTVAITNDGDGSYASATTTYTLDSTDVGNVVTFTITISEPGHEDLVYTIAIDMQD